MYFFNPVKVIYQKKKPIKITISFFPKYGTTLIKRPIDGGCFFNFDVVRVVINRNAVGGGAFR